MLPLIGNLNEWITFSLEK